MGFLFLLNSSLKLERICLIFSSAALVVHKESNSKFGIHIYKYTLFTKMHHTNIWGKRMNGKCYTLLLTDKGPKKYGGTSISSPKSSQ